MNEITAQELAELHEQLAAEDSAWNNSLIGQD